MKQSSKDVFLLLCVRKHRPLMQTLEWSYQKMGSTLGVNTPTCQPLPWDTRVSPTTCDTGHCNPEHSTQGKSSERWSTRSGTRSKTGSRLPRWVCLSRTRISIDLSVTWTQLVPGSRGRVDACISLCPACTWSWTHCMLLLSQQGDIGRIG